MTLEQQLDAFTAKFVRTAPAGQHALYEAKLEELRTRFDTENAAGEGDRAPDFMLPDVHGKQISLAALLQQGPTVLSFYRGGWCR